MNNFVFSQDPLLYASLSNRQPTQSEYDMRRQLDDAMAQYQALSQVQPSQQKQQQKDYLGEIDDIIRGLDSDTVNMLNTDVEYVKINDELQKMMQEEMIKSIKWKINSNQDAIYKMERMKEVIQNAKKTKDEENRKVMADINDYITNYADLTFEEYKKLKYNNN